MQQPAGEPSPLECIDLDHPTNDQMVGDNNANKISSPPLTERTEFGDPDQQGRSRAGRTTKQVLSASISGIVLSLKSPFEGVGNKRAMQKDREDDPDLQSNLHCRNKGENVFFSSIK